MSVPWPLQQVDIAFLRVLPTLCDPGDVLRTGRRVACHHLELKDVLGRVVVDRIMEALAVLIFFSVGSMSTPTIRCLIRSGSTDHL